VKGRLYFKAGGVHDILWNAGEIPGSVAFFTTADNAIISDPAGQNAVSAFTKWDNAAPELIIPELGAYLELGGETRYVRLINQANANHKALFEQYNGVGDRQIDLFHVQPDIDSVTQQPIIPIGFSLQFYEPFFTVGSGKNLLPCKRPFDVDELEFPLAIQDYRITFRRRYDRGLLTEGFFANLVITQIFGYDGFIHDAALANQIPANVMIQNEKIQNNLQLTTFSQDTVKQEDKQISTIEKYVPKLYIYATQFVEVTAAEQSQKLYLDNGFPSFLFIRLEWDNRENDQAFRDFEQGGLRIPRPKIQSLVVKLFGKENPFVSKLLEEELYHLCRKNSHKYCGFQDLWDNENAVLLSLEDIGLMGENVGYPNRKRLEMEFRVTWEVPLAGTLMGAMHDVGRLVQLRTVFVHENNYLRGDARRIEFYEVF
jgi:hypothetical protein